jgi:hypothetical protein
LLYFTSSILSLSFFVLTCDDTRSKSCKPSHYTASEYDFDHTHSYCFYCNHSPNFKMMNEQQHPHQSPQIVSPGTMLSSSYACACPKRTRASIIRSDEDDDHHHHRPLAMEILGNYWPRIVLTGPSEEFTSHKWKHGKNDKKKNQTTGTGTPKTTTVKLIKIPRRGLKHADSLTKKLLAKASRTSTPSPVHHHHEAGPRLITPSFVSAVAESSSLTTTTWPTTSNTMNTNSTTAFAAVASAAPTAAAETPADCTTTAISKVHHESSTASTQMLDWPRPTDPNSMPRISSLTGKVLHLTSGIQLIPSTKHRHHSSSTSSSSPSHSKTVTMTARRKSPRRKNNTTTKKNNRKSKRQCPSNHSNIDKQEFLEPSVE